MRSLIVQRGFPFATLALFALLVPAVGMAAPVPATQQAAVTDSAHASPDAAIAGRFEGQATHSKQHGVVVINPQAEAGWGWSATSDQRADGKSAAEIALVHPGADDSEGALQVSGTLKRGFVAPWAGAAWFPGSQPMQPADLSAYDTLVFQVRGKPGSYTAMLMSGSPSGIPGYASFEVTKQWQTVRVALDSAFPRADVQKVYFIAFSAAGWGDFEFELDDVRLQ